MPDTTPVLQYARRSQKALGLIAGSPSYAPLAQYTAPEGNGKHFAYSPDGRLYATASSSLVQIVDAATGSNTISLPLTTAVEIAFSPKGTFLSTWERPIKLEDGSQHKNLRIWNTTSGEEVVAFSYKPQQNWNLQFTEDEAYALRMVSSEIQVFSTANFSQGIHTKLRVEGSTSYSLSPGKNPCVAVFVAEKKGAPASVKIFSLSSFSSSGNASPPSSQKTFFKADKIQFKWNQLGTMVLFVTQSDVDKTNQNYYGETNMYMLSSSGNFGCRVTLDREGPIHDFAWSPNSKEFTVVYGYMPAKTTIFDHRVNVLHDFGTSPRNYVSYNPQGRLMMIAGFGNLSGAVDIWDRKTLTKEASYNASNTSFTDWSPDGRFLLCATLSPRMRVDNGVRILHWSGSLVFEEAVDELYQVAWRPAPADNFPFRSSLSPAPTDPLALPSTTPVKAAPTGAYRPPHARGTATPTIFKREDEGGAAYIPKDPSQANGNGNAAPPGSLSALQQKPKTRVIPGLGAQNGASTENGKKKKAENGTREVKVNVPSTPVKNNAADVSNAAQLTPDEKKRRALMKKLGAIDQLKDKRDKGEKLEKTQESKIAAEAELRKELASLTVS